MFFDDDTISVKDGLTWAIITLDCKTMYKKTGSILG